MRMKLQNNYVQMTSNSKWFNCTADHVAGICLLTASDLSRFIEFIFANVIFDTQKVKNSDHKTDLNAFQLYNLKIMIFHSFWVFVLTPIPKNENLQIVETHQKPQNTEIWVRNFKNPRNIVQITSKLQWFSRIVNHAAAIWVLKAFDPSEYIKLSLFLFMSVLILKQLKSGQNTDPDALECYKPENEDFQWFLSFRFKPYTQKQKLWNPGNSSKPQKYWNVSVQL